jgi:hypothetical protein
VNDLPLEGWIGGQKEIHFFLVKLNGFEVYILYAYEVFCQGTPARAHFQQLCEAFLLQHSDDLAADIFIFEKMLSK